ncbi:hypothetical protein [Helicobacter sp.]|uniref:hypothetical protein n=1 Tax=Helicobacter sp. TaxID=218 RepID=UPI0025C3AFD2|nr:hypothetical protein [Helicobacter sp.]MBR2494368.1 hypothetical protein [Helicobacter sp.]
MYNQGFYTVFLLISFGFGFVVFVFGFFMQSLFDKKPKLKPFTLKDFRKLIPKAKSQDQAHDLIEQFVKKFGLFAPNSSDCQEWLDVVKELTSLESIDTDKAAEIREHLSAKNPAIKKEISDVIGLALKTKKDSAS